MRESIGYQVKSPHERPLIPKAYDYRNTIIHIRKVNDETATCVTITVNYGGYDVARYWDEANCWPYFTVATKGNILSVPEEFY